MLYHIVLKIGIEIFVTSHLTTNNASYTIPILNVYRWSTMPSFESDFASFVRNGDMYNVSAFLRSNPDYHTNILHMRYAVNSGNINLIKLIYDNRGKNDVLKPSFFSDYVTKQVYHLSSPLIIAIKSGNAEVVETLLDYCNASSASTFLCDTTIHKTIKFKQATKKYDDILKPLESMEMTSISHIQHSDTIINIAAHYGNREIVSLILNHSNEGGNSNYMYGLNLFTTRDICDAQDKINIPTTFSINGVTKYITTPLHTAALRNTPEVAKLLIEKGADINSQSYEIQVGNYWFSTDKLLNATPLHVAILYGKTDMVKTLLENNADIFLEATIENTPKFFGSISTHNMTCLQFAKNIGNEDIISVLEEHITNQFSCNETHTEEYNIDSVLHTPEEIDQ